MPVTYRDLVKEAVNSRPYDETLEKYVRWWLDWHRRASERLELDRQQERDKKYAPF